MNVSNLAPGSAASGALWMKAHSKATGTQWSKPVAVDGDSTTAANRERDPVAPRTLEPYP